MAEQRLLQQQQDQQEQQQQSQQPQRGGAAAALVFSAPVVRQLVSNQVRLPPHYVGVRRIRPSNWQVRNELRDKSEKHDGADGSGSTRTNQVVYKITTPDGVERRMTTQEKKKLKLKLREERELTKKQQKRTAAAAAASSNDKQNSASYSSQQQSQKFANSITSSSSSGSKTYHQLPVSKAAIEQELADLRGDRDAVPPVLLSPSMSRQAFRLGILPPLDEVPVAHDKDCSQHVVIDDDLARQWAVALKRAIQIAEDVRYQEALEQSIRPMPYRVVPEVWIRLRPSSLSATAPTDDNDDDKQSRSSATKETSIVDKGNRHDRGGADSATITSTISPPSSNNVCSPMTMRKGRGQVDEDEALVVELLHRRTPLHISCGAKFGCDFLLYDGRREERHAFAGLRIIEKTTTTTSSMSSSGQGLPLPSPYDLTGYVRCLNTAGKLALLATVQHDDDESSPCGGKKTRVAIVDLALEKIGSSRTQNKRKRGRRDDVGKNLAKHREG